MIIFIQFSLFFKSINLTSICRFKKGWIRNNIICLLVFQAFHKGLLAPRIVWLLMGVKPVGWWKDASGTRCTAKQMAKAVEGSFIVASLNTLLGGNKSVAGLVS